MTVMVCRACGQQITLRSRFEECCPECGSEDLEREDAFDQVERELRCDYCGYTIDTTTRADADWVEEEGTPGIPASVDDPCPICGNALVPKSEASEPRRYPESKLAREAARKLHREHAIPGPPYQLKALTEVLGLEIIHGAFNHDGLLVGDRIEVPEGLAAAVERFVIAHETGHFVLRHEGERSKIEPEANAFASELLIPRTELASAIAAEPSVGALRDRFGVSKQALVYALMGAGGINKVHP